MTDSVTITTEIKFPASKLEKVVAVLSDVKKLAMLNPLVKSIRVEEGKAYITDVIFGFIPLKYSATSEVLDEAGYSYLNTADSPFPLTSEKLKLRNHVKISKIAESEYQVSENAEVFFPVRPKYLPTFVYNFLVEYVKKSLKSSHRKMLERLTS